MNCYHYPLKHLRSIPFLLFVLISLVLTACATTKEAAPDEAAAGMESASAGSPEVSQTSVKAEPSLPAPSVRSALSSRQVQSTALTTSEARLVADSPDTGLLSALTRGKRKIWLAAYLGTLGTLIAAAVVMRQLGFTIV